MHLDLNLSFRNLCIADSCKHDPRVNLPLHICSYDHNVVGSETFLKKTTAFSKPY